MDFTFSRTPGMRSFGQGTGNPSVETPRAARLNFIVEGDSIGGGQFLLAKATI